MKLKPNVDLTPAKEVTPAKNLKTTWGMMLLGGGMIAFGVWLFLKSLVKAADPVVSDYVISVTHTEITGLTFVGIGVIIFGYVLINAFSYKFSHTPQVAIQVITFFGIVVFFVVSAVIFTSTAVSPFSVFCVSAHGSEAKATRDGEKVECSVINTKTQQADMFAYQMENETSETDAENVTVYRMYPVNAQPGL